MIGKLFQTNEINLLFILFVVVFILILLKIILIKKDQIFLDSGTYKSIDYSLSNGIKIGNMQLIGQKDEQNDYFSVINKDNSLLAVIADGISNKKIGKYASVITVDILKKNFYNSNFFDINDIKEYFTVSFEEINNRLNDNIYGNKVGVTLACAIVKNGWLYFTSIGSCMLLLYRDKEIIYLTDINQKENNIKNISLKKDDIVILCSNGVYQSLTEVEIIREIEKNLHPYDKAMNLARKIQKKGYIHQDNATLILIEDMV
ncbi:PP2C family protein-serine/threonine phosphatase [Defluviitalea phaphyphila]|uniref:PP2C family protein-serine/threonine phosphatase n=1 Tax=Defluviitalea phaphyphila TaxID=1473580 RepID=UPI0007303ED6|nr:protein phosphatase 2C domain-containing protein [Defluviitalea phaphyphila]